MRYITQPLKAKPKVSVIMAVHNSEKFLKESIASVINQTFKDWELLIVDDCSTDTSLDIIETYFNNEPRITLVGVMEENKGPAVARNAAIKHAKGKYLAILDSDDICFPERFAFQYKYLEKHPNTFLVGSSAIKIDEDGARIGEFIKHPFSWLLAILLPQSNGIIHSSVMMKNIKQQYNPIFKYSHDYDMWLNFLSEGKRMKNLPRPLIEFRLHANSIGASKKIEQRYFRNMAQVEYRAREGLLGIK